jgi:hypothetical protein
LDAPALRIIEFPFGASDRLARKASSAGEPTRDVKPLVALQAPPADALRGRLQSRTKSRMGRGSARRVSTMMPGWCTAL